MSRIRFIDNDYSEFATITATSATTGFPASNAANSRRSLVWKTGGNFTVTAANEKVVINDGSNKAGTIPNGNYTYSTLATAIAAALNLVSSDWSCSYSTTTMKFTISRLSSATLRLSFTTNTAWDMLGFTTTSDIVGTSWTANQIRIHTNERYQWSVGVGLVPSFVGVIGPLGEAFSVSSTATVRLLGNTMPVWTSPPVAVTLSQTDKGIHQYLTNTDAYPYWALDIVDRTNPLGPEGIKIGRAWLGDYVTLTATNVSRGFNKSLEDQSDVLTSESGVRFYNQKTKYRRLSALEIINMPETDRLAMEAVFDRLGIDQSFFLSVDPTLLVTPTTDDLTIYGTFDDAPKLRHLFQKYYSMSFDFREAV